MFERFLERLSISMYNDIFILKGGMLIAAIVGMDARSTMDLDMMLRNLSLNEENIRTTMEIICSVPLQDDVSFTVTNIGPIRPDDVYGGYRVSFTATYDTIETPLSIDVSVGDVVTPNAVRYTFGGIFDDKVKIELWAYNIETVMAEKMETILRRNVLNTRPRDFYDVYILSTTQSFNRNLLQEAIAATARHRGTTEQIANTDAIIKTITESNELKEMWRKYQRQFSYASDISFEQIITAMKNLLNS
jgi:hypothetical protein